MDLLPEERAARDAAGDGQLYAWVQSLYRYTWSSKARTHTRRPGRKARLWVCRRGQKPTETVFTWERLAPEAAREVADAINRGRT